jgi:ABC-type sulfate transport system permease component
MTILRRRVASTTLLLLAFATPATALSPCGGTGIGWCLAKRFPGDVAGGELGFRFG